MTSSSADSLRVNIPKSNAKFMCSLVIPAYNEELRVEATLFRLKEFLNARPGIEWEVLIVVEKSADFTLQNLNSAIQSDGRFHILSQQLHRGKGYAVRSGMLKARGEFVFFMDFDLSTSLQAVDRFLHFFYARPDIDVLIGSRRHLQSKILKRQNPVRELFGVIFNRFAKSLGVLTSAEMLDTQCGFKAFRKSVVLPIFQLQKIDGFAFDIEVLLLAHRLNYKIATLPVEWCNAPHSQVRIWRDSLKMLRDLFLINHRFKKMGRAICQTDDSEAEQRRKSA